MNNKNTNEERCWNVYIHVNIFNGKKYIGITKQNPKHRWSNGNHYKSSPYFWNAIQKYGWDNFKHIILYTNFTEEEAKWKENLLIKLFHTWINDPLNLGYNMTLGGDGTHGYKFTQEQIDRIREKRKGVHLSEEHKDNIRKSLLGRKFTEEWKNKISESHYSGNNPVARKIVHIDKYYNLIKIYDCARDVERDLGLWTSKILNVCHGKQKHTGGMFFMFYEDYMRNKDSFVNKTIEIKPYRRGVIQKDYDGNVIAEYKMIKDAEKAVDTYHGAISDCCRGIIKSAAGYVWEYIE